MPQNGDHRYLLIDSEVDKEVARKASLVLAGIAAERDDPCGLVIALRALGLIEEDEETS